MPGTGCAVEGWAAASYAMARTDTFWKTLLETLPTKAPAGGEARIPHDSMPASVQKKLRDRGYEPIDVRLENPSEDLWTLMTRAAYVLGTIDMNQSQVALHQAEGKRLGLFSNTRARDTNDATPSSLADLLETLGKDARPPIGKERKRKRKDRRPSKVRDKDIKLVAQSVDRAVANAVKKQPLVEEFKKHVRE